MSFLCEFAMDCLTKNGESCDINPDNCNTYHRKMIAEGEASPEGWEFNRFESNGFASFWRCLSSDVEWTKTIEKQWEAEQEKKRLYYPEGPCDFCIADSCHGCEHSDIEDPCEFGLSEECVEPSLRDTNSCWGCWLYSENDVEARKSAKQEETVSEEEVS